MIVNAKMILVIFVVLTVCQQQMVEAQQIAAMVLGDWGGEGTSPYTTEAQYHCAESMKTIGVDIQADFVALLGDNFYEVGVTSVSSQRFAQTFERVYTGGILDSLLYYVLAGNHDWLGNVSAQVAYTNVNPQWIFPDFYYKKTFTKGTLTMDLVMIDAVPLLGNSDLLQDPFNDELPGPEDPQAAADQWTWIEEQLAASTADYLIVASHYPVYSGCSHGSTSSLVNTLKPMLEKYNVNLFMSGHDHCLEHINENKGVDYMVTGAAKECCYTNSKQSRLPAGSLKFAVWNSGSGNPIDGGYATFVADTKELVWKFHDCSGKVLYTAPALLPRTGKNKLVVA